MVQKKEKIIWVGRYFFIAASVIWGIIALCGLFGFGWIGRLSDLTPAELVVQMGALFFPIAIFYLLGSYIDRNRLINTETAAARAYLEELIYPSDVGAQYVNDLNSELKEQIKEFKTCFSDVSQQTNRVREDMGTWIEDLNDIVTHMDTQVRQMSEYIQQLNVATVTAQDVSADAGQNLATQADILLKVSDETGKRLNETAKQLKTQTEEITQNVHAVEQAEKNMTKALDQSSDWIVALSENSRKMEKSVKTTEDIQSFLLDADKILLRFKEIGTTLDLRLKNLKQHNTKGESKLDTEPDMVVAKEFTQQMQQILDKLQGMSVEMMSIFKPKDEANLWEQYYAGDKAVFMRYIKNVLNQSKRQKILNATLLDPKLQELIKSYMTEFELLTRGLEDSPWLGVLVGSDPGRLYMVLATLFKGAKNANKIS